MRGSRGAGARVVKARRCGADSSRRRARGRAPTRPRWARGAPRGADRARGGSRRRARRRGARRNPRAPGRSAGASRTPARTCRRPQRERLARRIHRRLERGAEPAVEEVAARRGEQRARLAREVLRRAPRRVLLGLLGRADGERDERRNERNGVDRRRIAEDGARAVDIEPVLANGGGERPRGGSGVSGRIGRLEHGGPRAERRERLDAALARDVHGTELADVDRGVEVGAPRVRRVDQRPGPGERLGAAREHARALEGRRDAHVLAIVDELRGERAATERLRGLARDRVDRAEAARREVRARAVDLHDREAAPRVAAALRQEGELRARARVEHVGQERPRARRLEAREEDGRVVATARAAAVAAEGEARHRHDGALRPALRVVRAAGRGADPALRRPRRGRAPRAVLKNEAMEAASARTPSRSAARRTPARSRVPSAARRIAHSRAPIASTPPRSASWRMTWNAPSTQ